MLLVEQLLLHITQNLEFWVKFHKNLLIDAVVNLQFRIMNPFLPTKIEKE